MLDLMEAHSFIKSIVPKAEYHAEAQTQEEKAAEDFIEQTLFWGSARLGIYFLETLSPYRIISR